MSQAFFRELNIPPPLVNLGVGSGTPLAQTAEIMRRLEPVFLEQRPDWVVVVGDVNSTVAAALAASEVPNPAGPAVEAGLRSFDRSMPEELNRIVTDAVSDRMYVSEPAGVANLKREGVDSRRVALAGNVMIDTLLANLDKARAVRAWERFNLRPQEFALATLHRPSNVDVRENLQAILAALRQVRRTPLPFLFPASPANTKAHRRIRSGRVDQRQSRFRHRAARLFRYDFAYRRGACRAHRFGRHAGGNDCAPGAVSDAARKYRAADHRRDGQHPTCRFRIGFGDFGRRRRDPGRFAAARLTAWSPNAFGMISAPRDAEPRWIANDDASDRRHW